MNPTFAVLSCVCNEQRLFQMYSALEPYGLAAELGTHNYIWRYWFFVRRKAMTRKDWD